MAECEVDIRFPKVNGCWENCGECKNGSIFVQSVLVSVGDRIKQEDALLIVETGKMAIDFPSPVSGRVTAVYVQDYDVLQENDRIVRIAPDTASNQ